MRRLARKGHRLTLFTAQYPNCLQEEIIDDIKFVRRGGKYGIYKKAVQYYKDHYKDYDLIIDEINTRPFLTPKFVKGKPIIAFIHQLAREFWFYETPFPISYLGFYYLEKKWLSYYRDIPTITVSNSSKMDLEALGFKQIFVVPEGLDIKPLKVGVQKEVQPTIIFVGRMKKVKLPHHAVQAFSIIKEHIPDAKMWVIGDGYMLDELMRKAGKDIIFYGHIPNDIKYELMAKAHIALVPAVREGWGLVATEFNAMGTPAIGYNVPGLRDSIKHGVTGILSKHNSPQSLAEVAIKLLQDRDYLAKLSYNAFEFSRQFNWDNTADAFEDIIINKTK